MINARHLGLWARRDRKQFRHLAKFARRESRKRLFLAPDWRQRAIGSEFQDDLNAHNAFARVRFRRILASLLFAKLRAKAPDFIPDRPVYFLTILDRKMVSRPGLTNEHGEADGPTVEQLRKCFARHLRGLNYIGMIEPGFYVSTHKPFGVPRLISYHVHALVWDVALQELEQIRDDLNLKIRTLIPYTSAAHFDPVRHGDLRQMVWYVTKMPREQTQCWVNPTTKRFRSFSRSLNGINSVWLFDAMSHVTLLDVSLAGGSGKKILARTFEKMSRT